MFLTTKITVIWDVMPCTLMGSSSFETLVPSRWCHIPESSNFQITVHFASVSLVSVKRIISHQLQFVVLGKFKAAII
jgi:hypothetical protein